MEYLNTSHVKVQSKKKTNIAVNVDYLNTSHVKVQYKETKKIEDGYFYLNTSHVKVQFNQYTGYNQNNCKFKYISC